MQNEKKYITEIIGNEYQSWNNENIFFDSGTGTGKSTFIFDVLIPYAKEEGKNVLFLTNRKPLYESFKNRIKKHDNAKLITYQGLQAKINRGESIPHYDYIFADEAHYIISDATFNGYTDVSFEFLTNQHDNVVIYSSATMKYLIALLEGLHKVKQDRIYSIAKDTSYIDGIYFYEKEELTELINDIQEQNPSDRIVVFVNSTKRQDELHAIYGDRAYYMRSATRARGKLPKYIENDCINENTFDKQLLITTKVLDNGIDLKDISIKHIFCEIVDLESAVQAIGRKRSISENDHCNIYIADYDKEREILGGFLSECRKHLDLYREYKEDPEQFIRSNPDSRNTIRFNKIFYSELSNSGNGTLKANMIVYLKYLFDEATLTKMLAKTKNAYKNVLLDYMGDEYRAKVKELEHIVIAKDNFTNFMETIKGKKLFKEDQKTLKQKFTELLGLKDKHMGLHTMNGKLQDCNYPYTITSAKEYKRQPKANYLKKYWMVQSVGC